MLSDAPIIQAAGIRDRAEAELLVACGMTHLGFPLRLDYHTPDCTDEEARKIIRYVPAPVMTVLITYQREAREIAALTDFLGVDMVQVHGNISVQEMNTLRSLRPGLGIIKSLVIAGGDLEKLTQELHATAPFCDLFITDTFDPETGATGATGKTHDWEISRELARLSPHPLVLAGGLNPENVEEAIRSVRPAGVDAHTGLEDANGRKDPEKARRFVQRALRGFAG
jgi:phosphoribosylanthranilate isomerase